ncbi:hypothetical protein V6N11_071041 [Hibiscus sabdariffa]|uniref:Uncharacterized protein n=1 Tax=Hibiscus sabdariffa TaxID=183260 RepID=A0ABR1ZMY5_9ROSI
MGEENKRISKEEEIAKIKDDGDFDKLRLKIIRKLKDSEELRNGIIAAVKQSAALNRSGAENMKLRQLSDAIHDEVGNKVMGQISDSLWEIIKRTTGFLVASDHQSNLRQQQYKAKQQLPRANVGAVENFKEQSSHSQVEQQEGDVDVGVPPGFSEEIHQKQPCDEEPDVPPGFG